MAQPVARQHDRNSGSGRFAPFRSQAVVMAWAALVLEVALVALAHRFWTETGGLAPERLRWVARWALWGGLASGVLSASWWQARRLWRWIGLGWFGCLAAAARWEEPWPVCLALTAGLAVGVGFDAAARRWPEIRPADTEDEADERDGEVRARPWERY